MMWEERGERGERGEKVDGDHERMGVWRIRHRIVSAKS
jgi:hypothetical protein